MGKILKTKNLTTGFEAIIVSVLVASITFGVYMFAPGLRVSQSKKLKGLTLNSDNLNNITKGELIAPASESPSTSVVNQPLMRIAEYAWNGNAGMIAANGGPRTTKGSLMEASKINLDIIRLDGVGDLRETQLNFCTELNKGVENPVGDKSAFGVSIMGDGVAFYISTTQQALDNKFGKGKYHVQEIAAYGSSYGEDKVIGPKSWKDNPKSMEGALISSVTGDGDWILAVNFASANSVRINPDVTTYDSHALNFTPSENDDYINSVKELIKSQKTGYTVPLKEVIDGKLTGKTINKKIDGATTWTPGDKLAFDNLSGFTDIVSTKDFPNQMATTLVVVKEWALKNDKAVSSLLKATYTACNQIKQYDEWAVSASQAVAKTYNLETPKYWYDLFKGEQATKEGLDYHIGGSKVMNYADAMQYFGITDGVNRYKSVYEQVSTYLTELNPCNFNQTVRTGVVPYEDAVNLYFLKSINDVDAGTVAKIDYSAAKTEVMAKGEWRINFATGSTAIEGSSKDLETIYHLLIQAEGAKIKIVGHTDNVGNPTANLQLSKGRANSVVNYLTSKGIDKNRFQTIDGAGDTQPIAENTTAKGKSLNRRVVIALLK